MRIGVEMIVAVSLTASASPACAQDFSWMFEEGKPASLRTVISGSMTPALLVGDRIAIFTQMRLPERGDILMFDHPNDDEQIPWVKRVVGLPGDRIKLSGGRLFLNGAEIARTLVREYAYLDPQDWENVITVSEYSEQFPGEAAPHLIHEFSDDEEGDETPEFIVPDGHLFMIGDNRDISYDSRAPTGLAIAAGAGAGDSAGADEDEEGSQEHSRAIGFVPMLNVVGRVRTVMMSLNPCNLTSAEAAGAECLKPNINKRL
ncbi:MAG: signal peptidase [Pseudomonadota bacterium]|jgi:signal peptidase I